MKNKKKISVYTRSQEMEPASYYRLTQYFEKFKGIDVKINSLLPSSAYQLYHQINKKTYIGKLIQIFFYFLMIFRLTVSLVQDIFRKPDFIVVSRALIPRYIPSFILYLLEKNLRNSRLIWDFDDHIIENKEITRTSFSHFCYLSNTIVVTHGFLKNLIPSEFHHKVILLPTTDGDMGQLDLDEIQNQRKTLFHKEIHLVWVATSGNLPNLEKIIPALDEAAQSIRKETRKKLVLNVVCDFPLQSKTKVLEINNIKWTRAGAIESMAKSHIGIMPLIDSPFSRGKGGFKLVQYMSIGLPVLASKVGFNLSIVDEACGHLIGDTQNTSQWIRYIEEMSADFYKWQDLSRGAYQKWETHFSFPANCHVWEDLLELSVSPRNQEIDSNNILQPQKQQLF